MWVLTALFFPMLTAQALAPQVIVFFESDTPLTATEVRVLQKLRLCDSTGVERELQAYATAKDINPYLFIHTPLCSKTTQLKELIQIFLNRGVDINAVYEGQFYFTHARVSKRVQVSLFGTSLTHMGSDPFAGLQPINPDHITYFNDLLAMGAKPIGLAPYYLELFPILHQLTLGDLDTAPFIERLLRDFNLDPNQKFSESHGATPIMLAVRDQGTRQNPETNKRQLAKVRALLAAKQGLDLTLEDELHRSVFNYVFPNKQIPGLRVPRPNEQALLDLLCAANKKVHPICEFSLPPVPGLVWNLHVSSGYAYSGNLSFFTFNGQPHANIVQGNTLTVVRLSDGTVIFQKETRNGENTFQTPFGVAQVDDLTVGFAIFDWGLAPSLAAKVAIVDYRSGGMQMVDRDTTFVLNGLRLRAERGPSFYSVILKNADTGVILGRVQQKERYASSAWWNGYWEFSGDYPHSYTTDDGHMVLSGNALRDYLHNEGISAKNPGPGIFYYNPEKPAEYRPLPLTENRNESSYDNSAIIRIGGKLYALYQLAGVGPELLTDRYIYFVEL